MQELACQRAVLGNQTLAGKPAPHLFRTPDMSLIQRIDALLPQTQCGKCGHGGCLPYAQGLAAGEAINKCPPGGTETIIALAQLLEVPVIPLDTRRGSAPAQVAYIREAECIGCTKCIQACPVDAIVGAAKLMHTVIVDECTGCDLCVAPCPVDCIELRPLAPDQGVAIVGGLAHDDSERAARAHKRERARRRFEHHKARLARDLARRESQRQARLAVPADPVQAALARVQPHKAGDDAVLKQAKVAAAMTRAQWTKTLRVYPTPPTLEHFRRLEALDEEARKAEAHLAGLQPQVPAAQAPAPGADVKRLKIQLAMRRAELGKLERADNADATALEAARQAVSLAQQALDASSQP
ncbi:electron transport complex subunit RsxB [Pseudomonas sp.]|uniref:electron transport complex subunit RsxB n=1 Tax=Pseudomonas sp. TaxID=306 RepID=UPI00258C6418|nr:electron transport complex subunit RsxB [Pseudomonas sp.]